MNTFAFRQKYKIELNSLAKPREQNHVIRADQAPVREQPTDRLAEQVYNVIRQHHSEDPIHGWQIAERLQISTVQVREQVNYLRIHGTSEQKRICSVPAYFIARTVSEIAETVEMLKGRAHKILAAAKGIESSFDVENQIGMF
jgi:hypothetical protein